MMIGESDMKKKKTLLWVLIGLILIAAIGVGLFFGIKKLNDKKDTTDEKIVEKKKDKEEEEEATPLLYKVTKDGSNNVIYLFGSIHVADNRAYPMREEIEKAYEDSDYLAVEFDLVAYAKDINKQTEDLKMLVYDNGDTIANHLSKETYDLVVDYLTKNKLYNKVYDMYKPALFYSLVTQVSTTKSGLDANKGIDMYFLNKAHNDGKSILEIESSSYQYALLASFSDKLYDILLTSLISAEKISTASLKNLYEAWLEGNEEKIAENVNSDEVDTSLLENLGYSDVASELNTFSKKLINERNAEMFKKVEEYFKDNKKTLVVVGAGHIVGDTGLAKNFKEKGYKVELIEYEK